MCRYICKYASVYVLSLNLDSCVYDQRVFIQSWVVYKYIFFLEILMWLWFMCLFHGYISIVGNVFEGVWQDVLFRYCVDRLNVREPFSYKFTIDISLQWFLRKPFQNNTTLDKTVMCEGLILYLSQAVFLMLFANQLLGKHVYHIDSNVIICRLCFHMFYRCCVLPWLCYFHIIYCRAIGLDYRSCSTFY